MPLRNIVPEKLIHCSQDTPVREVALLMKEREIGAIVITDNFKLVGVVTDRDLVLRAICRDLDAETTPVSEVMTSKVVTVCADAGLGKALERMKHEQVRRVVVIDELGAPLGVLSFGDVYRLLTAELSSLTAAVSPTQVAPQVLALSKNAA